MLAITTYIKLRDAFLHQITLKHQHQQVGNEVHPSLVLAANLIPMRCGDLAALAALPFQITTCRNQHQGLPSQR